MVGLIVIAALVVVAGLVTLVVGRVRSPGRSESAYRALMALHGVRRQIEVSLVRADVKRSATRIRRELKSDMEAHDRRDYLARQSDPTKHINTRDRNRP